MYDPGQVGEFHHRAIRRTRHAESRTARRCAGQRLAYLLKKLANDGLEIGKLRRAIDTLEQRLTHNPGGIDGKASVRASNIPG